MGQNGFVSHDCEEADLKDPVCGMSVTMESPNRYSFQGDEFYFCSDRCKRKFEIDPAQYLEGTGEMAGEASALWYTCPMHPEIRQQGPGSCPKCGMSLEPEMPTLDDSEDPEFLDFRRRFWVSLPFTAAVFVCAVKA